MNSNVISILSSAFAALLLSSNTFGQEPSNLESRDKSKYAINCFQDDDHYCKTESYKTVSVSEPNSRKIRNVILMIADGMGMEQLSAAWVLNGRHLNITDNFSKIGLQWTYSLDKLVTDSAAAGTALATGEKTTNGKIAVSPDGNALKSITSLAQEKGMRTGTAVVCRICDATPAVFSTHSANRDSLYHITGQYVDCGLDFLFGGGLRWWENRPDGRDLTSEVRAKGYTFTKDMNELKSITTGPVICLTSYMELPRALDRGDALNDAVAKALELLPNKKGFFLMIEGSCIDDYSHANKTNHMIEEIFDFDRTVGNVLEWAEKDGETLVIVTADHATGGMTLLDGNIPKQSIAVNFSSTGHNGIVLPVFAWGPRSEEFTGIYENCILARKIMTLLDLH